MVTTGRTSNWFTRPAAREWIHSPTSTGARAFHESLPGHAPTPLTSLPDLADELGVRAVLVKDESSRWGLPAFKVLGASWAVARLIAERTGSGTDLDSSVSVSTRATVMAGLNCGTVSTTAWPLLRDGCDAAVAVSDDEALKAVADLGRPGVSSGPSGAATLAGVRVALAQPERRRALRINGDSTLVLLSTEGSSR